MDLMKLFGVLDREMLGSVLGNQGENKHDEVNKAGEKSDDKLQAVACNDGVALMPYPFSTCGSASTDVETASASQAPLAPEIIQHSSVVAITVKDAVSQRIVAESSHWMQFVGTAEVLQTIGDDANTAIA